VLARLYRRVALRKAEGSGRPLSGDPLSVQEVEELLGPEEFLQETVRTELAPGVAPGLAWTTAGGVILYIEVALLSEGHDLIMTGHLGDVMKESARTAYSYVLSQAHSFGLPVRKAKDGPSAGLAIVVALVSALIGKSARADTAMTGEVTLSGLVLPVGGIHEKVLAAHQAGLKRVLIPHQNVKDLVNIPASLKDEMDIHLVDRIEDALPLVIANFPHHARRR
jgi:ATP-dependent Lon protease